MIKITISKKGTPESMAKELPRLVKAAIIAEAKRWRDEVMPRHFDTGASRRYGYMGRTDAYNRRKRKNGSPPALVWSGRAERKMLSARREPTGTAKKITLRIPSYGFFSKTYSGWPSGHTMGKEVTAMTKQELEQIYQNVQSRVTRDLNALKTGGATMRDLRK
jgi:hypothetical protein